MENLLPHLPFNDENCVPLRSPHVLGTPTMPLCTNAKST